MLRAPLVMLGRRTLARRFGFTVFDGDLLFGSPATGEEFAVAAPTYSPAGRPLVRLLPFFPVPFPAVLAAEDDPGDPLAPAWPSGVAANRPLRFPAGGSGGAPMAGCRFNAMTWPRAPNDPCDPPLFTLGGGGTTCCEPFHAPAAGNVRCAATGRDGAGAITALAAMFNSPSGRFDATSTLGGGAMMAFCGSLIACAEAAVDRTSFGGGATTLSCRLGRARCSLTRAGSGGGDTTEFISGASR